MIREVKGSTFETRLSEIRRSLWEIEGALRYGQGSGSRRSKRRSPSKSQLSVVMSIDFVNDGPTDSGRKG